MAIAANVPDAAIDPANAIVVNQGDEEPVQLDSLCMNCHDNVSAGRKPLSVHQLQLQSASQ